MLLVMVYMTNGVAESNENSAILWELVNLIRSNDLPFIVMGDWNMTREEMEKTMMMGSSGPVVKKNVQAWNLPALLAADYRAKHGDSRILAGLVSNIQTIDGLRHSGMKKRARADDDQSAENHLRAKTCGSWSVRRIWLVHSK